MHLFINLHLYQTFFSGLLQNQDNNIIRRWRKIPFILAMHKPQQTPKWSTKKEKETFKAHEYWFKKCSKYSLFQKKILSIILMTRGENMLTPYVLFMYRFYLFCLFYNFENRYTLKSYPSKLQKKHVILKSLLCVVVP